MYNPDLYDDYFDPEGRRATMKMITSLPCYTGRTGKIFHAGRFCGFYLDSQPWSLATGDHGRREASWSLMLPPQRYVDVPHLRRMLAVLRHSHPDPQGQYVIMTPVGNRFNLRIRTLRCCPKLKHNSSCKTTSNSDWHEAAATPAVIYSDGQVFLEIPYAKG